ncbi:dsRBD fold-containing protein [Streptomyces sp. NPDC005141]
MDRPGGPRAAPRGTDRHRARGLMPRCRRNSISTCGYASRHPSDSNQPRVGEEVAGARALNELAVQLLTKAHDEIDAASGRTSHARRHPPR